VITKPDHDESAEVVDSKSEEAQITDSEQATYASANNDLKGTKAYQEADVSGLYNLAMAIIDYRGHRVVAQVCMEIIFRGNLVYIALLESYAVFIMCSVICFTLSIFLYIIMPNSNLFQL
jgi:hypothetical protein